mmetsp:Transcript_7733/g.7163  ORF Transcript_7733/g.7163 Transcript_7733/m.7163 type:complete len:180 (-) Transcript_7733:201-740(-)
MSLMLGVLKSLLNAKVVFREILIDYQDLIHKVLKLLDCSNPYIAYISSSIIYQLMHFVNNSEAKAESNNKKELIKGSLSLTKYIKKGFFVQNKIHKRHKVFRTLHIWSLYEIISSVLCDRKETTHYDNYWAIIKEIFYRQDLKLLHIIDNFAMSDNFALSFGYTKILNEIFVFFFKGDK